MSFDEENAIVSTVDALINKRDYGEICFKVGKFIESSVTKFYENQNGRNPKSAKVAFDYLIETKLVDRVFGQKLHLVRELRNVEAHELPFNISCNDARLAVETLNHFIYWLHNGYLIHQWDEITKEFDEGVNALEELRDIEFANSHTRNIHEALWHLYRALYSASDMKVKSLNLSKTKEILHSSVKTLATAGVDVRSTAWQKLVSIRNNSAHSIDAFTPDILELHEILPDLKLILSKLNPLDNKDKKINYPQVTIDERLSCT